MTTAPRLRSLTALLLSLLIIGACSGSDGDGPTEPEPTPAISLSVSPSTLELEQGTTADVTVTLTRTGGFEGAVTVIPEGLPEGVQGASISIPGGSTAGTLTLTASASAPATASVAAPEAAVPGGEATQAMAAAAVAVTLRATAPGVSDATASVSVTVTAAPPPPTGGFSLSVDPTTLSVEQGSSGTVAVAVSRDDPFSGTVTLAVSGSPDGVSVGADPVDVSGDASTLTVQVGGSATPGEYTLTVAGSGEGVSDASATFTLVITEAASGSFALALSSNALSLQQGASGSIDVTVSRQDPFTGAVSLSASGAPSGATVTVDPATVTGSTATVGVALGAGAALGEHTITLTGTGEGVPNQTASFTLTVTAGSSGSAYTWSFCPATPTWFAVKDGEGAWTAVAANGNSFDFNVASERVGIAWVISGSDGPEVNVRFIGRGELDALGAQQCRGTRSVNGTTTGVGATNTAFVAMGGATAAVVGSAGTTFTLNNIRDGASDLFATNSAFNLGTGGFVLDKLYLERGLDPADGATVAVDFTGSNAFDPGTANVTANGLNGAQALLTVLYVASGTSGIVFQSTTASSAATRPFPTVPAGRQADGDFHGVTLTTMPSMGNLGDYQSASMYFKNPTDRTVTFGPALGTTTLTTDVTAPYLRPRVVYTQQAEYGRYFYANYQQQTSDRNITIYMTDDYFGSADIDLIVPDFSGTDGWDNAWGLVPGEQMTFAYVTSGWDGGGAIAPATLAEGLEIMTATRTGQINP